MASSTRNHIHKWKNYGRQMHGGVQQQKCSCGAVRNKKVSKAACWFSHDWKNSGKKKYGEQKQVCTRCGRDRKVLGRRCLISHTYSAKGQDSGYVRCTKCGLLNSVQDM